MMKLRSAGDKKLFFRENWLELFASLPVALFILPFLSSALYAYDAIVLIRILRLLLLFRVSSKFVERFLEATYLDKIMAAFIFIILGSVLVLYCFDPNVTSIFEATWFVFQTITTVGYGDVIPTSPVGKLVGLIVIIAGVLMFSIFTASFSYLFNERVFKEENEEFNKKVNLIKENLKEVKSSIDEIKEKASSNDERLVKMEENIDNLSAKIDNLIEIVEKK